MVSFFDTAKRKDRVAFAEARHDLCNVCDALARDFQSNFEPARVAFAD